ncbi:MAG: fibronectin type III domain-containing protein [Actinomycetales bacterium]|nr:fibronectin type III domain-containing protein [Actinomycetales bacterium]
MTTAAGTSPDSIFATYTYITDTTAPGPVTGLAAAAGSPTSVTLSWTNPTDADYAGVMIRRTTGATPPASITDGDLVAALDNSATSHTDTGLTPSTGYAYAVFTPDSVPQLRHPRHHHRVDPGPAEHGNAGSGHRPGRCGRVPDQCHSVVDQPHRRRLRRGDDPPHYRRHPAGRHHRR